MWFPAYDTQLALFQPQRFLTLNIKGFWGMQIHLIFCTYFLLIMDVGLAYSGVKIPSLFCLMGSSHKPENFQLVSMFIVPYVFPVILKRWWDLFAFWGGIWNLQLVHWSRYVNLLCALGYTPVLCTRIYKEDGSVCNVHMRWRLTPTHTCSWGKGFWSKHVLPVSDKGHQCNNQRTW